MRGLVVSLLAMAVNAQDFEQWAEEFGATMEKANNFMEEQMERREERIENMTTKFGETAVGQAWKEGFANVVEVVSKAKATMEPMKKSLMEDMERLQVEDAKAAGEMVKTLQESEVRKQAMEELQEMQQIVVAGY